MLHFTGPATGTSRMVLKIPGNMFGSISGGAEIHISRWSNQVTPTSSIMSSNLEVLNEKT